MDFLPTHDEATLDDIFDRINRNVARLTRQELRHARFNGQFAQAAERMADLIVDELPRGFPRIAEPSRRQMKDVELAAQLLLLVENGPESFSQDDLDEEYAARDEGWEKQASVEKRFREVITYLQQLATAEGAQIANSRLRNQADFYSLFGAAVDLSAAAKLPDPTAGSARLAAFLEQVENPDHWGQNPAAANYYDAARSASNDLTRRKSRIETIKIVLTGA